LQTNVGGGGGRRASGFKMRELSAVDAGLRSYTVS
jgi:hypothetical protein